MFKFTDVTASHVYMTISVNKLYQIWTAVETLFCKSAFREPCHNSSKTGKSPFSKWNRLNSKWKLGDAQQLPACRWRSLKRLHSSGVFPLRRQQPITEQHSHHVTCSVLTLVGVIGVISSTGNWRSRRSVYVRYFRLYIIRVLEFIVVLVAIR